MLPGSLSLGRLAGAELKVHWSAGLVALLVVAGLNGQLPIGAAFLGTAAFMASILFHEVAHAVVARRFGVGTSSIVLWGLGGVARLDAEPPTPRAEGWIAAAGPLASLGIGAMSFGASFGAYRLGLPDAVVTVFGWTAFVNGAVAIFNLLPGAPLDGGRILRAVRWSRHGDRYRAMGEAARGGQIIGWALGGVGLALLLDGRPGLWLVLTGFFIAANAKGELAMAALGRRLAGVTVGELTWYGVAETGTDMDTDSMIWQRQRLGGAGAVAVCGDGGELAGLVLEDQLWAVPSEQRPWVMLTALMAPFATLAKADPDDELATVLPRLNPLRPVVTVWRDDRFLGVVPPKALQQRLQLR
ncbi:site-2 protease family protein [soil metagenome]